MSRSMVLMVAAAAVIAVVAVVVNVPSSTPYSPYCTGPEGYSDLVNLLNATVINSPSAVGNASSAVILLPLDRYLSTSTCEELRKLVAGGATLLIADEGGYSNVLLKHLGIRARVANYTVLDEVRKLQDRFRPVINVSLGGGRYVKVVTFRPSYIVSGVVRGAGILGSTSRYAYADVDGNDLYTLGEVMGKYLVVRSWRVGRGLVVLIADLDALSNSLLSEEGNSAFLTYVARSGRVYLLLHGLDLGGIDELKYVISGVGLNRTLSSRSFVMIEFLLLVAVFAVVKMSGGLGSSRGTATAALLLYIAALGAYSAVLSHDYVTLIPAAATVAAATVRRAHWILTPLTLAAGVCYAALTLNFPAFFAPIALLAPYAVAGEGAGNSYSPQAVGPTSTRVLEYAVFAALLSVLDVRVLAPLAMLAATSLTYSLLYFIRLGSVKADVVDVPKVAPLGRPAPALIAVSAPSRTRIILECGEVRAAYAVEGQQVLRLDLPTEHIGPQVVVINVYAVDEKGFSGRLVRSTPVKYSVVPLTSKIMEVLRRRIISRAELRGLVSEVEVMLIEVSGKVGVPTVVAEGTGAEVAGLIREYLRRVRLHVGVERFVERFVEVLEEVGMEKALGAAPSVRRGMLGEYLGVRYYVPGDSLKDIHWKKSLSRQSLVVKEFSSPSPQELAVAESSPLEPVVILDLFAPNHVELDRLVFTLLSVYFSLLRKSPVLRSCLVIAAGGAVLIVKGKVIDLIYRLYKALRDFPTLVAEYMSVSDSSGAEVAEAILKAHARPKLHSVLVAANIAYGKALVRSLIEDRVIPPKVFTLIHSDVMSFRYGVVKQELTQAGFMYVPLRAVAEIAAAQVRGGAEPYAGG